MENATVDSIILKFYKGKNFFITGATGFVGICLIEKILRTLPDCGKLYILMRPKKNKTISERLDDLINNSVFEHFRKTNEKNDFSKLIPIQGDINEDNLGISQNDRNTLIENVDIVIHTAANSDIFDNLKNFVSTNLLGTRKIMEFCQELNRLQAMVHVSSAFANSQLSAPEEVLYPVATDVEGFIKKVTQSATENLSRLELKYVLPYGSRVIKGHRNGCALTKHLAEHEVNKYSQKFPCVIVRPSLITPTWKEPVQGWTTSRNGSNELVLGVAKGVIRRLPFNPNFTCDFIPVDIVVNHILVAAHEISKQKQLSPGKPLQLAIFQCTSNNSNQIRYADVVNQLQNCYSAYPLESAVWTPGVQISHFSLFMISHLLLHIIPGFYLDLYLWLTGQKTIAIRTQTKAWKAFTKLKSLIIGINWKFDNTKSLQLAKSLNAVDKELFYMDIKELKWDEYFRNSYLGIKGFICQESISDLKAARRKASLMQMVHVALQVTLYYNLWSLVQTSLGASAFCGTLLILLVYSLFYIIL